MTKKDYELFANEIFTTLQYNERGGEYAEIVIATVELCKRVFKKDNPLFQADKFERACYEGKHIRKSIKGAI